MSVGVGGGVLPPTQFTMRRTKSNMWESQALQDVNNAIMRHKTKGKCHSHEHVLNIGKKRCFWNEGRGLGIRRLGMNSSISNEHIPSKYQQSIGSNFSFLVWCGGGTEQRRKMCTYHEWYFSDVNFNKKKQFSRLVLLKNCGERERNLFLPNIYIILDDNCNKI